jgi:hypothetical protein
VGYGPPRVRRDRLREFWAGKFVNLRGGDKLVDTRLALRVWDRERGSRIYAFPVEDVARQGGEDLTARSLTIELARVLRRLDL